MELGFLRLECRIQRWNSTQPGVFLIDANRESLPTAVYNPSTFESMDHAKGRKPRPLRTHAYNFNRILDEKGNAIIESRAVDKESAEGFIRKILEAAEPVDQRTFHEELDRIIWPQKEERSYLKSQSMVGDMNMSSGAKGMDFIESRSSFLNRMPDYRRQTRDSGTKKMLIRQLTDLISTMDEEDLEALLKLARTLAEE